MIVDEILEQEGKTDIVDTQLAKSKLGLGVGP